MPTQNLLKLLLLLMLMLRIMLATACWFGSWRLVIKLNFCSDFEHKGWSSLSSCKILELEFAQHFAADVLRKHLAFGSVLQWLIVINALIEHVAMWNMKNRSLIWSSMLINTSLIIVIIGALWPLPLIGGIVASLLYSCSSNARQIFFANLMVNYLTENRAFQILF